MFAETDFSAYVPQPRVDAPRVSIARVLALACAITLHAALLLHWSLPASEADRVRIVRSTPDSSPMELVLIEQHAPEAPLQPAIGRLPPLEVRYTPTNATPAPASPPAMSATFSEPEADAQSIPNAASLEAQIPDLARQFGGPLKPRPNGTLPQLPGSAVAIVPLHAPVKRWKQITPEQVGNVLARMIVGTMASNPDDFEKAREGRDPLREMTEAHLQSFNEPHCDDPDDPLADRRCWDNDPNLRR